MRRAGWCAVIALALAGCRVPVKGGLTDVDRMLQDRGLSALRWNQSRKEEDDTRQLLDRILADELTAARAVEVALANSPRIQVILERLGVAQADVVQAGLLHNPSIGFHPGIPFGPPASGGIAWEVNLSMNILDLFVMPLRKKLARLEFERAKLEVASAIWSTALEVQSAYYDALAAKLKLALQRTVTETAAAAAEFALRQEAAGTLSALGLATEQGGYVQMRMDLVHAESAAVATHERLVRLLGLWGSQTALKLPDALPPPPERELALDDLERYALAHRLDLLAAEREAAMFDRAVKNAKHTRFITALSVGADTHKEIDNPKVAGPSISLELPIFDQGQAKIARLVSETRRARRQADALGVDVRSEVREQATKLLGARSLAEYLRRTVVPLRERTVALAQKQYNAMLIGVYQLLAIKQAEVTAWRDYLDSVRDYWVARAELERAAGAPLVESTFPERTTTKGGAP
ncbi:MAG: TolC family protein [Polyangia bacterium]